MTKKKTPDHKRSWQSKKLGILVVVVPAFLLIGVSSYIFSTRNTTTTSTSDIHIDSISPAIKSKNPQMAVFMRNGEIWMKDFATNQEKKLSKTPKVDSPKFSPNGKNIYYFEIGHAVGGFPRYKLYVNDIQGISEKTFTKSANYYASKLKWSDDGKYLGMVLFDNTLPTNDFSEEAYLYDTSTKKEIFLGKLSQGYVNNNNDARDQYLLDRDCTHVQDVYVSFCEEYVEYIKAPIHTSGSGYKQEKYSKSKHTKPEYRLARSERLDNGLVVLEYYTGEPQNPEYKWGIAGGSFIPGYDKGVTQTYTILLDESTSTVTTELPLAVDTDFIFQ